MAGAVSAGAYTAGVMDYLIEALDNWQKAKDLNLAGIPRHHVIIELLSGASAGGMTAVITAAAIQKQFPPVNQFNYQTKFSGENPLFDSWVNQTEIAGSDMMSQLLDDTDILNSPLQNPQKEVRSIFNSLFIEKIAHRILNTTVKDPTLTRPYFAEDLEVFTTITNLRGFNYQLEFITENGKREDRMILHRDLIHLQLNPSGTYRDDGKIPFHFETAEGLNKDLLTDAAIATGSFPLGLAPRVIVRDPKYINDNCLLKMRHSNQFLIDPLSDYHAVCLDGGVINNEPYDLADKVLINRALKRTKTSGRAADSLIRPESKASTFHTTILMIDPFPNFQEKPLSNYLDIQELKFTFLGLIGAMRQQLLVKSDLLERVIDENDFSRFMVAPIRTKKGIKQMNSLACGAVGGFGGFFSKKFRIHDFLLGRRNCQRFLQEYLCVPLDAKNPIIQTGYGHLKQDELSLFLPSDGKSLPIIPDIRLSQDKNVLEKPAAEEEFAYPSIELKYLMQLERKVKNRLGAVLKNLSNGTDNENTKVPVNPFVRSARRESWYLRYFVSPTKNFVANRLFSILKITGKDLVARKFIDAIITDMDEKGLLHHES